MCGRRGHIAEINLTLPLPLRNIRHDDKIKDTNLTERAHAAHYISVSPALNNRESMIHSRANRATDYLRRLRALSLWRVRRLTSPKNRTAAIQRN